MTEFTRAICFTDIHFGLRSDLEQHNRDCLDFIDWVIEQFHAHKCDAVIFMGDWFHNQVHVQWDTLWYSEMALKKLSDLGVPVYFCIGNHDMWFKTSRDIHSHAGLHRVPNVRVIDRPTSVDDCLFCPYLIGAEFNSVAQTPAKYVFGHFIMPGFMVNENYEMPDEGGLNMDLFEAPEYVFSGHFHKRQWKKNQVGTNVIYIGNCFGHNWHDNGDRDRGCMIFERGAEPIFLNWTDGPNFHYVTFSQLEWYPLESLNARSVLHVEDDAQTPTEVLNQLKDTLSGQGFRSVKVIPGAPVEENTPVIPLDGPRENITDYFRAGLNQVDTQGSKYRVPLLQTLFGKSMERTDNG